MKKLFLFLALLCACPSLSATTYYIATASNSPAGSDSNSGTDAAHPWLTPNHAVNCGDVILAAASTSYAFSNFNNTWGTVTCAAGNDVAWVKCATFDTCKFASAANGAGINKSYWGMQGFEATNSGANFCFVAYSLTTIVHHIIFANNIANGCGGNGFGSFSAASNHGADYLIFIGNIAYNGATDNTNCYSGISLYEPLNSDTLPGTHMYIAGNYSFDNVDPATCAAQPALDGEGIILDTFDGSQSSYPSPYSGQTVVENNYMVWNGNNAIEVFNNTAAPIYVLHNTTYGNHQGATATATYCGEFGITSASTGKLTEMYQNIVRPSVTTSCNGNTLYGMFAGKVDSTNHVYANYIYISSANYTGRDTFDGFNFGPNNVTGTDPVYANPVDPGAPSCGAFADVPHCMATVRANYTPTIAAATTYGSQPVSTTSVYDPLFPSWLCSVTNLPPGLITMGCLTGTAAPAGVTITGVTVK